MIYTSGPQPFWHQGLDSWKIIFPRMVGGGGDGSDGNASDGERWGAAHEASLASLPLTSCCAAHFLTGRWPVVVSGLGVGDPCYILFPLSAAMRSFLTLGFLGTNFNLMIFEESTIVPLIFS